MPMTWLITGCATGFGALTAQLALNRGDAVVATDRDVALLTHLQQGSGRLVSLALDVTSDASVQQAVADTLATVGVPDVLVNNAGLGVGGPFEESDDARARLVFEVNTFGPMRVTKAILPHLRAAGRGHIINVSSDSGAVGFPFQSIYTASKHALEGWAECLSHEVAPFNIHVSLVQPCGTFRTGMPSGATTEALARNQPDSPYHTAVERVGARVLAGLPHASEPQIVAEAILRLADDPTPPLRTPIGPPDRVGLVHARQHTPDEQYVQMVRAVSGGSRGIAEPQNLGTSH